MTGFLGGSFDPIHLGHLNLAISLKEAAGLDHVIICPAWVSPFKEGKKMASPEHRLNMCRLAIEGLKGFEVLDYEIKKGGPSYTIDTIKYLNRPLRLLLGDDQLEAFSRWKEADLLKQLAPPLVGSRLKKEGENPIPIMEISSTLIRERLKSGLPCVHLVPYKVLDYIFKNDLYSLSER